jgi:hypothetical protein
MNQLEKIGVENLLCTLYEIERRCTENNDSERKCRDVLPFMHSDIKKAISIINALKENTK